MTCIEIIDNATLQLRGRSIDPEEFEKVQQSVELLLSTINMAVRPTVQLTNEQQSLIVQKWYEQIDIKKHVDFCAKEAVYCTEENKNFEEARTKVLMKRQEFLRTYTTQED